MHAIERDMLTADRPREVAGVLPEDPRNVRLRRRLASVTQLCARGRQELRRGHGRSARVLSHWHLTYWQS
jgi:hypothetical protein